MMKKFGWVFLLVFALAPPARAGAPSAKQLFDQGVELYNQGKIEAACNKFEESYQLAEEPGTLFNLASCHEKEAHYFEARAEFAKLAEQMQAAGKSDRAAIARQHSDAAAAHAPKLELVFPQSSNVTRVALDGKALPEASWKQPIFVVPGSHQLVFSAENKKSVSVSTAAGNDRSTPVQVPVLEDATQTSPTSPASAKSTAAPPSTAPGGEEPAKLPQPQGWSSERTIGAVLAGAGVIGIGVGTVFGLQALSQKSKADDACGDSSGACSTSSKTDLAKNHISSAKSAATVSTVGFALGAGALAVGAYLFFDGGHKAEMSGTRRGVRVAPVGPGDGGVSLIGVF